ncbi:hypothetical protein SERLADRAFT_404479 [Serpula lacrymans var. lacrymans S7.9]|uniref:Uncharacterized protein n=1 Tax=Serpula lacrymans var. lacrymans (strain S7.9) TaxID=578457 RepID=F8NDB0_SERL9|nr:uncharacterized protein SERLADRAFT_404479 [Serpula lacrymans var. lacrymans S7.9]EGO30194.1 hypothetical protein SERLADRAFT_404479 [Serpula lacrymans var. lacrymans S7.9]
MYKLTLAAYWWPPVAQLIHSTKLVIVGAAPPNGSSDPFRWRKFANNGMNICGLPHKKHISARGTRKRKDQGHPSQATHQDETSDEDKPHAEPPARTGGKKVEVVKVVPPRSKLSKSKDIPFQFKSKKSVLRHPKWYTLHTFAAGEDYQQATVGKEGIGNGQRVAKIIPYQEPPNHKRTEYRVPALGLASHCH